MSGAEQAPKLEKKLWAELARDGVLFLSDRRTVGYSHLTLCLQQGFSELEIPVHALTSALGEITIDQRPVGADFRLQAAIPPDRAALTLLDVTNLPPEFYRHPSFAGLLDNLRARRLLLLSQSDANSDLAGQIRAGGCEIALLATAENRFFRPPGLRLPWAFGLSRAILGRVRERSAAANGILRNFRPSLAQDIRLMLDLALLPHLDKHFAVDRSIDPPGHRQDGHFARLATSELCCAYGGAVREDVSRNPVFGITDPSPFVAEPAVLRWDSWRFWEALAAGCPALHLDHEKYGLLLPVMPEPWRDYIPVDLAEPRATAERILAERSRLPEIGASGRAFALQHYAPRPVAERLIRIAAEQQP
jgi:hypothetical protein